MYGKLWVSWRFLEETLRSWRNFENFEIFLYQKTFEPCKLRYSPCTLCHVLSLRTSERLKKCSVVHWAPQWLLRGYLIILYIYWNSSEVFWNVCVGYVQRITEDIGYSLRLSDNHSVAPVYLHPGVLQWKCRKSSIYHGKYLRKSLASVDLVA